MEFLFHLVIRYIPFWALPSILIAAQMGMIMKKQGKKKFFHYCIYIIIFNILALGFFIYAGGPTEAVNMVVR